MTSVHFNTLSFVTAVSFSNFVQGFPANPPPTSNTTAATNATATPEPTALPPHQLAFESCDFVADCNHMHGKIPIPCADNYCDRFLLCIDNRPTMQQCDPIKHWLFWNTKANFNPLSLQCEEDFKTCDWYLTVRLSSSDDHEAKSATSSNDTSIGYDTAPIKAAADSARDGLLDDLKQRASEVIQQITNSTADMIERLKKKTEEISKDVQMGTLAILQDLKDENAKNSTHVAQIVMRAVIDQIHLSSSQVKDGIASVVATMKEKIGGVLSAFQENAAKEVESAREALHKVLPKPVEHVVEAAEPLVVKETAQDDEQKNETDKPVEPVKDKTVDKRNLSAENINLTSIKSEEMVQGDEPPREEVKPEEMAKTEETKVKGVSEEEKVKEEAEEKKDKLAGSAAVTSASYLVAASSIFVAIAQFL